MLNWITCRLRRLRSATTSSGFVVDVYRRVGVVDVAQLRDVAPADLADLAERFHAEFDRRPPC